MNVQYQPERPPDPPSGDSVVRPAPARPRSAPRTPVSLRRKPKTWVWITAAMLFAFSAAGLYRYVKHHRRAPPARYLTTRLARGAITETIRATGTVQPVLQVQVGAQVSGRIADVHVDFNSHVHRGDLLAEIDPTPYRAQVAQVRAALLAARAQLAQARANYELSQRNLTRQQALRERNLNAPADLDAAVGARDASRAAVGVAEAQIAQAEASLQSAETNLTYTRIYAPIDGVVSTRSVDPGQTVAASFQTPTLFVIANDLTHMRVIADVDEANIGKLHEHMTAVAHVDAFPHDTFRGEVTELRIGPTTTNGVVTYPTVIDVDNPENKLRPGMTATITVVTQHHENVFRVPNAALRYHPSPPEGAHGGHGGAGGPGSAPPQPPASEDESEDNAIYVLRNGRAVRVPVTVGPTDGVNTEVSAPSLTAGMEVVIDETDANGQPRASRPRMRMF